MRRQRIEYDKYARQNIHEYNYQHHVDRQLHFVAENGFIRR